MGTQTDILSKVDNLLKLASFDANLFNKEFALNRVNEFMTVRNENPNFTSGDICKQIGTTSSVMSRYFSDLKMSSPFRHMQQPKGGKSNKERVRYSYDEEANIYVRDNKNGRYGFNIVSKTFKELPPTAPAMPVKSGIDHERNANDAARSPNHHTRDAVPKITTSFSKIATSFPKITSSKRASIREFKDCVSIPRDGGMLTGASEKNLEEIYYNAINNL